MSFIKKLFNKPPQKLHLLSLEKKIDTAFKILYKFTPLVEAGIEDIKELKDDKLLIKNSILFLYREMKRQPGKSYILNKHLILETNDKYEEYLSLLSQILRYLSKFSPDSEKEKLSRLAYETKKIDENLDENELKEIMNKNIKELDGFFNQMIETNKENAYYLSELNSIDNDLNNGTNFKKIKFYDYE